MAIVTVQNTRYTADSLYQWDKNQVLEIRGLSLQSVPEIHFTTAAMDRAIVRQASMDAAGVITVNVPNSILQQCGTLKVYVCTYEGATFQTLYKLDIMVKARPKPNDYTFEDDGGEVYSFNALENLVYNAANELKAQYREFTSSANKQYSEFVRNTENHVSSAKNAANAAAESARNAENAAGNAASEEIKKAILKSDIAEILKVSELPESPAENVLYVIV